VEKRYGGYEEENLVPNNYPEIQRQPEYSPEYSRQEYKQQVRRQEYKKQRVAAKRQQQQQPAYPKRSQDLEPADLERSPRPESYGVSERAYEVLEQPVNKVYERSSSEKDQLEGESAAYELQGESFQPAYQPYAAPREAYNSPYAPIEQKGLEAAVRAGAAAYNKGAYEEPKRLNFQIHGQEGPHSYRFGYDTGVGYNRQFRYEERDSAGVLHGRYGYYDQEGKLQIVNYTADPYAGFHAEGDHVPKPGY